MHAAVLHEYGAPRFDQFADPEPTQGAVVVQVAAAALSQFGVMHAAQWADARWGYGLWNGSLVLR